MDDDYRDPISGAPLPRVFVKLGPKAQCSWCSYQGGDRRRAALRCIRDEGHAGVHRAYNGRWNAEAQFKTDVAVPSNTDATGDER